MKLIITSMCYFCSGVNLLIEIKSQGMYGIMVMDGINW